MVTICIDSPCVLMVHVRGRPGPGMPPGQNNQGRFLGPFILGGITGGLISPLFWAIIVLYIILTIHLTDTIHTTVKKKNL